MPAWFGATDDNAQVRQSSIWTAAGFAFVSGLLVLPTLSSAQYINIEGVIRRAEAKPVI
jgi:hypothetical protein